MMPDLNGRDVVERLKADWPHLADRVIFMTGGAFTAESREFLQRTPYRVLTKPFSLDELRGAILTQMKDRIRGHN